jgi:hypothetical protein
VLDARWRSMPLCRVSLPDLDILGFVIAYLRLVGLQASDVYELRE